MDGCALLGEPVTPEFYVDFETVSDLDEDFSTFPIAGGQPLIFMIGCGYLAEAADRRVWTHRVFTASNLTLSEERRIIDEWLAHMTAVCEQAGVTLDGARAFHWSPAETSNLTSAYNAAFVRQGEPAWPRVPCLQRGRLQSDVRGVLLPQATPVRLSTMSMRCMPGPQPCSVVDTGTAPNFAKNGAECWLVAMSTRPAPRAAARSIRWFITARPRPRP